MSISQHSLFGINYTCTNYSDATKIIIENAILKKSFGVSALAVHGLIEAYKSDLLKQQVNKIHLVVPDGQPVKWVLNSFFKVNLKDRVYGPELTKYVLTEANKYPLKIYLYGSTQVTINLFENYIKTNFPNIIICGTHADRFREATNDEDIEDISKINNSGANIILVGRGCPRQEKWVAEHIGKVNGVMMAVGAAFDFYAGTLKQAPKWMQSNGLEWFYRLIQEPQRLWKRYLFTNTYFIYLFLYYKILNKKHL